MSKHERFHLKTLDDLKKKMEEMSLSFPLSEDFSVMYEKVKIGKHTLPNRFAVHPMEGFDSTPNGAPGELSFRRYKRYAEGGSGLVWYEATAVLNECRTNPGQFWLHKETLPVFKKLTQESLKAAQNAFGVEHRPLSILQITHSGRYSKKNGKPSPIIAHHSEVLDPIHKLGKEYQLITDDELDALQETYVNTARLAYEAGFDGVDIKSCHRYLLSELLASFSRENSRYGGSFENRTRFLRETAAKIKKALPELIVTSRLNVFDAIRYPYGWGVSKDDEKKADLTEPLQLIKMLREIDYPLLNVSIANPYFNPHWGRPYDHPIVGMNTPEMHPLEGVANIINIAASIQKAFPDLAVIGSGYTWLRHLLPFAAAGVVKEGWSTLIGQGRGVFAYPDSVKDIKDNGSMNPNKSCIACSACTQLMRDGDKTGCVIRDSKIYGPIYRAARARSEDSLKKEAERCRDCEFGNCSAGCPANVDVPGFIKAFERGDIKSAYNILKECNVLPELCAYVCPSEVQCEQNCMETILKGVAVPVREIQKYVSKKAREMGLVEARVPDADNGNKVAIVGAGPAGLSCAVALIEKGFKVDLYDLRTNVGGTPDDVIPAYRLTIGDVLSETGEILKKAIEKKRLNIVFGFDLLTSNDGLSGLQEKKYKSIFLGMGLGASQKLPNAVRPEHGVEDANSFLRRVKSGKDCNVPARVAVLGGGNTAMDAAVVAKKCGARDVYLIYRRSIEEMPAWPKERDHALEEGIHFLTLTQPLDYIAKGGKLTALKVARTVLGEPDKSSRRKPITLEESESELPVDLVIEALGQNPVQGLDKMLPGLDLNSNGFIKVNSEFKTSVDGVYAGGDIVNGGTTAVRAVAEGMKAAKSISLL
jgi:NADPH-dependent glutamate synthase beta subunit-like oxidoreductase/2,4-dienoyl-CoA reductase-like NADH-dependent reductase (Old Yellow Enzyme family)